MNSSYLFAKLPLWLKDHPRRREPEFVSLIAWMSVKAFLHGGTVVTFNGCSITLQANQFTSSVNLLALEIGGVKWQITSKQSYTRHALDALKRDNLIDIQTTNLCSLYTLSWIESERVCDKPSDKQVTSAERASDKPSDKPRATNPDIDKEPDKSKNTLSSPSPVPVEAVKRKAVTHRKIMSDSLEYSERYLEFYNIYPRKEGKSEGWRIWRDGKLDEIADIIITAITWQAPMLLKREVDKRPMVTTYLNNRRWEDGKPPEPNGAKHSDLFHSHPPLNTPDPVKMEDYKKREFTIG